MFKFSYRERCLRRIFLTSPRPIVFIKQLMLGGKGNFYVAIYKSGRQTLIYRIKGYLRLSIGENCNQSFNLTAILTKHQGS